MKKILIVFCLSMATLIARAQDHLNIMTFNIRVDDPSDSLNAWPYRTDKVSSQILFHEAHIIGIQEALHTQVEDLDRQLTKYRFVGVAREDGKQDGEYSAIFFDTTRVQSLQSQTFWLSQTPQEPGSKSWDAAITRIVTWAKFRDKKTKKEFYVFNTHFDHMGKVARVESAKLLLKYANQITGSMPFVVTGDFNASPNDEPIKLLVNPKDPLHLLDSKAVSSSPHYGPSGTFTGFQSRETNDLPIDHIFIKNGIKVLAHATLSQTWSGRFSSDHFPVMARIVLQ